MMNKIGPYVDWARDRAWVYIPTLLLILIVACMLGIWGLCLLIPFGFFVFFYEKWAEKRAALEQWEEEQWMLIFQSRNDSNFRGNAS
jgi:hypothetical protein